jgi:hypothetical protein
MKFNKWTLGLAAVGVVSLASAAKAEEKMSAVSAALSSTTISGYVDTSAQWNFGDNGGLPPYSFGGVKKADGFNLNVVQLTIAKPLEEGEWAAGYHVDVWLGPDANGLASQSSSATSTADLAIRQAYVNLRMPVGNGIDWKVGVFDTVIGYETLESGANPNFTRSYGFSIEPTTHTGVLASYRINDAVSVSAGVANTFGPSVNARANPPLSEANKTYMGSVSLTAPSDWGWAAGATLYGGIIHGFNSSAVDNQTSLYVGTTWPTPLKELKVGASFDYVDVEHDAGGETWNIAGYASYQATEKLSVHARGEYLKDRLGILSGLNEETIEGTLTVQYDLWKNVITRGEFRWDHNANGPGTFGAGGIHDAFLLAANVIYKF